MWELFLFIGGLSWFTSDAFKLFPAKKLESRNPTAQLRVRWVALSNPNYPFEDCLFYLLLWYTCGSCSPESVNLNNIYILVNANLVLNLNILLCYLKKERKLKNILSEVLRTVS